MITRRDFLKLSGASAAALYAAAHGNPLLRALATPAATGLSDPALQPKFATPVPDALSPGFKYMPDKFGRYKVDVREAVQYTGLVGTDGSTAVPTPVWGYTDKMQNKKVATWPGMTFEVKSASAGGPPKTEVIWSNSLKKTTQHLLPVDTSLHWCYSLPGYDTYSIANNGVPIITHLHGGHTDFQYDGNPEFFYTPGNAITGPQWANVPGGFTNKFSYDNDVPAGNLWYHDHALGITRLNVYAGLAGFYFVRDNDDTGEQDNPLGLPAWPYEKAYAIQDRMFRNTGELFYPAFPGDPFYEGFIDDEGANLPPNTFPGGGPSALAEFFGDHMVVNGVIWPFENVEPRNYRMHLLNGCDSRYMVIRFRAAASLTSTDLTGAGNPLNFHVIGSDQGLASEATMTDTMVFEPGSRYDIVFDFKELQGQRIIMENIGWDAPFGGDFGRDNPEAELFEDSQTDRIMAFDVVSELSAVPDVTPTTGYATPIVPGTPTRTRKVALFEGRDEFGRLQPLLGTAEPATDYQGNPIYHLMGPLAGEQINGSVAWHEPTTENPALGTTEEWEVWNATGDAHPVHLHLVHFEIIGRQEIAWDSRTDEDDRVLDVDPDNDPQADGTYLVTQPVLQHNGAMGQGFKFANLTYGPAVSQPDGYVENTPKDMVTALPGQITRIKATFDKPGRYVWHCHILSHEDHEMMRVLHVGPGA